MHVHTEFSCDSEAKIEDYILEADKRGITTICFTEHVDLNTNDYGYNYYSAESFWNKFIKIKSKSDIGIEVLAGIEFGEPHLYENHLLELTKYPYDFVIGSIHWMPYIIELDFEGDKLVGKQEHCHVEKEFKGKQRADKK